MLVIFDSLTNTSLCLRLLEIKILFNQRFGVIICGTLAVGLLETIRFKQKIVHNRVTKGTNDIYKKSKQQM